MTFTDRLAPNIEASRKKKMPKKSKRNISSGYNSENLSLEKHESFIMPPSNLQPSLPSSSFASWEQAFHSVASQPVISIDLLGGGGGGEEEEEQENGVATDATNQGIRSSSSSTSITTSSSKRTSNVLVMKETQQSKKYAGPGDLKQVSLIAQLCSHHNGNQLQQEGEGGEQQKELDSAKSSSRSSSSSNSSSEVNVKRGKRKMEQRRDDVHEKNDDDDAQRGDDDKKRRKKEKRSKKKKRLDMECNTAEKREMTWNGNNDHEQARKEDKKQKKKEKRAKNKDGNTRNDEHDEKPSTGEKRKKKEKKSSKQKNTKGTVTDGCNEKIANVDDAHIIDSNSTSPLEGQMVMHEDQTLFVLVDKKSGLVYSMERSETGKNIPIGKVELGNITIVDKANDDDSVFPFVVDPDDHCESPLVSYKDIKPMLDHLAKSRRKASLAIYDPYYCNGLVRENLLEIGYSNVYNQKEDAYKTWDEHDDSQPYPSYDVFITNPPYSGDHPERLVRHLTEDSRTKGKPWFLLMPQFIHKKDYYTKILATKKNKHNGIMPFYLVPKKRYVYLPPKDFREKKASDVHKKSSPFVSMWFVWGGSEKMTEELIRAYENSSDRNCELARSTSALRDLRRKKHSS